MAQKVKIVPLIFRLFLKMAIVAVSMKFQILLILLLLALVMLKEYVQATVKAALLCL